MDGLIDFCNWFFSLQWDAVTLPWIEANKYTTIAIIGIPVIVFRWARKTIYQMKQIDKEYDRKELTEKGAAEG